MGIGEMTTRTVMLSMKQTHMNEDQVGEKRRLLEQAVDLPGEAIDVLRLEMRAESDG